MRTRIAILASATLPALLILPAATRAQDPASSPVMDALRQTSQRYQQNLVGAAQEMPPGKYAFKPTAQEMSFGQLVLHIATSNEFMCSAISGKAQPQEAKLEATSPKDQLVARLKESFTYCGQSLAGINDTSLAQQVPFFGNRQVSRATAVMGLAEDWADHYGQAAIYLRLNGKLPPTAQRRNGMH